MHGMSAFTRETAGGEASPHDESAGTLIWDSLASGNEKRISIVAKPPSFWYFVIAAQADQDDISGKRTQKIGKTEKCGRKTQNVSKRKLAWSQSSREGSKLGVCSEEHFLNNTVQSFLNHSKSLYSIQMFASEGFKKELGIKVVNYLWNGSLYDSVRDISIPRILLAVTFPSTST